MSKENGVEIRRRYGELVAVPGEELPFLVEATIDEKAEAVGLDEETRTGDGLARPKDRQLYPQDGTGRRGGFMLFESAGMLPSIIAEGRFRDQAGLGGRRSLEFRNDLP